MESEGSEPDNAAFRAAARLSTSSAGRTISGLTGETSQLYQKQ